MDSSVVIFINKDAIKLEELFLNENWCLSEIFDRVYSISVKNKKLKWLVKIYDKKKYAKRESENLNKLRRIEGVPKVLAVGLSDNLNYVILSEAPGMDLFEYIQKYGSSLKSFDELPGYISDIRTPDQFIIQEAMNYATNK